MKLAIRKKWFKGFTAIVFSLVILLSAPGIASADPSGTDCRRIDFGTTNQTAYVPGGTVAYYYTAKLRIPYNSSSDCHDINVTNIRVPADTATPNPCVYFRVRFYPTSGGNYVTTWRMSCGGTTWRQIATDVINGTYYRVEAKSMTNPAFRPYYTLYD
jgi:hypothetical protein